MVAKKTSVKKTAKKAQRKPSSKSASKPKPLHKAYTAEEIILLNATYKKSTDEPTSQEFFGFIDKETRSTHTHLSKEWLESGGYELLKGKTSNIRKRAKELFPDTWDELKDYYTFPTSKVGMKTRIDLLNVILLDMKGENVL